MFVGIVVIGILGLLSAVLFQELERKLVPWRSD
jgi:ABC-type nitrate/sulfonate/bicarbonate transport system permease component